MKIVINIDFGGFSVSKEVYDELGLVYDGYGYIDNEDFGIESDNDYAYRCDLRLIQAIEKIGLEKSAGKMACLSIVEIPDNIDWEIENYDGVESIHENHRVWG